MAMFTPDQLKLRRVPLDDRSNLSRYTGRRVVWRWECPGDHREAHEVVATEDEPAHLLTEAAIRADPYCYSCRRKAGK